MSATCLKVVEKTAPVMGFRRGFLRGGDLNKLGSCAPLGALVVIVSFTFFVWELLAESYINSEIFTRIRRKLMIATFCAHDPNYRGGKTK